MKVNVSRHQPCCVGAWIPVRRRWLATSIRTRPEAASRGVILPLEQVLQAGHGSLSRGKLLEVELEEKHRLHL